MLMLLSGLAAATCPDAVYSPTQAWPDRSAQADPDLVAALDAALFQERDEETRAGIRTDGVAVFYRGELLYERYGADYTAQTSHLIWSATKSFTSALVGIAEHKGLLDIDESVCTYVDFHESACQVTVRNLLEFSSGLAWRETYEGEPPTASSVLAMLYGEGRQDMAQFAGRQGLEDAPGSTYQYSSGDTNMLSAIARTVLEPVAGERYPWTLLFEPLGITSATWERDAAGTPVGSSYLYMTPRDMGRFGQLMLNDGCWEEDRLLPEGWVERVSTPNPAVLSGQSHERGQGGNQGQQFWLNTPNPAYGEGPRYPDIPENAFAAMGHWKQRIWVLPDQDIVAVRTGDDRDGSYSDNDWVPLAMALAEAYQASLPEPEPEWEPPTEPLCDPVSDPDMDVPSGAEDCP